MEAEAELKQAFALEADTMRPKQLDLRAITRHGRRKRSLKGLTLVAAAVASIVGVTVLGVEVWEDTRPKGETLSPVAGPDGNEELQLEAAESVKHFFTVLDAPDERKSWDLLTPAAQQRIGSLSKWEAKRSKVTSFLSWVAAPEVDVTLARLPASEGDLYVATATAPPADGKALLQAIPLSLSDDGFLIDLASAEFGRTVSLEPLNPVFMGAVAPADPDCTGEGCSRDLPELQKVSDGDVLSVSVAPVRQIDQIWMAVGSQWVAEPTLSPDGAGVLAEATFDGSDVETGQTVFLVAVRTPGGLLEAFGYRVMHEEE